MFNATLEKYVAFSVSGNPVSRIPAHSGLPTARPRRTDPVPRGRRFLDVPIALAQHFRDKINCP
jgi:hypothetical protein